MIIKALIKEHYSVKKEHCAAMKVHCAAERKCAQPVSGEVDTLGNLPVESNVDLSILNRTGPPMGSVQVKWARDVSALKYRLRVQPLKEKRTAVGRCVRVVSAAKTFIAKRSLPIHS